MLVPEGVVGRWMMRLACGGGLEEEYCRFHTNQLVFKSVFVIFTNGTALNCSLCAAALGHRMYSIMKLHHYRYLEIRKTFEKIEKS